MKAELLDKYDYTKYYFCNECNTILHGSKSICTKRGCRLRGIVPKRCRFSKRTSLHLVRITPQLVTVLKNNLDLLVEVHRKIHENQNGDRTVLSESTDFDVYRNDIESFEDFRNHRLNLLLTLSTDGVTFKKLSRSQAWPLYLRIEGLPYHEKNRYENIILSGILFCRRTPSEATLNSLFCRLREELTDLAPGLAVLDGDGTAWSLFPTVTSGVIDFSGLKILFNSPSWNSTFGCHLCTLAGEKVANRICWYTEHPRIEDRRTRTSILRDASAQLNGLSKRTGLMNFISMERFRPDSLHLISEGITCDLFRELFQNNAKTTELRVKRDFLRVIIEAIQRTPNNTHASRFILGVEDLSGMTGSEKDSLMFVLFPLLAAENLCDRPVGCACIASYWLLVRILERTNEFCSGSIAKAVSISTALKQLWAAISKQIFTLKLHCLIDHCILQDLPYAGSPFHWSASPFERIHQQLQLRAAQGKSNCEASLIQKYDISLSSNC
ncbi:hypothetical protein Y032_0016g2991 [Ancylostoma ceylanicum]|uniref:Uncharacterized protein n=1 Tax=Ancylostoma ceylanicum TaxID=53326 RepID=A0A016V7Z4_9BILA|nr:hypothetical protein Y032_0016g2991 [Ancylostoma ceylanicum]